MPKVNVADCDANAQHIVECIEKACLNDVQLLVLPELCVTGYTCGDLFGQSALLRGALNAIEFIAK